MQVSYQSSLTASGQRLVAAISGDGTPLLVSFGEPNTRRTGAWREATTRRLADSLGIEFGAPFNLFTKRWTGQYGDSREDSQYMDLATTTINKVVIDGPLHISQVWHRFKLADWHRVADNWVGVKTQLDDGIIPTGFDHDFAFAERIVMISNILGMVTRQQSLLWGGEVGTPDEIITGGFSKDDLLKIAEFTVKCRVLQFKGRIAEWVVASEAVARNLAMPPGHRGRFWLDALGGLDGVATICQWVREVDPVTKLTYTEDLILETSFFRQPLLLDTFMEMLTRWKANNVGIDSIDIENNFWIHDPPSKSHMLKVLKAIQALGYEIAIPEVTVTVSDVYPSWSSRPKVLASVPDPLKAQAQVYRDTIEAYLEVGAGFGLGNMGDFESAVKDRHPEAKGMIVDETMQPKPAYYALTKAMFNRLAMR